MDFNIKVVNGRFVTVWPPGNAEGCYHLRDRGLALSVEVTAWPRQQERYYLTTGERCAEIDPLSGNTEDYVIQQIDADEVEARLIREQWLKQKKRKETHLTLQNFWSIRAFNDLVERRIKASKEKHDHRIRN